jgi:sulfite oxidase
MAAERTLSELYADDPERAEARGFGRRGGVLAALGALVGAAVPFGANLPRGLLPVALAQGAGPGGPKPFAFPGKDPGLTLLGDRPLVAETPEALLDDDTTPIGRFFIRNNGQVPEPAADPDAWTLTIDGEVDRPLTVTLGALKARGAPRTYRMVMECGGNGRSFFQPQARGNQWTNGGVGCAEWTGIPLADLLREAGLAATARHTGLYGADPHLSGDPDKPSISRGMPIEKALEPHTLVVWAMNGQPLPTIHGGPLRLLTPGWPGSVSPKWLTRVWVRDREHDGPGMGGTSYRVPTVPIVPGSNVDGRTGFANLESMPVRSIITSPANGRRAPAGTREVTLRGAAWAGEHEVRAVDVSADFGRSWTPMTLADPRNRYDWRRWTGTLRLPSDGYYELWSRATDDRGVPQPHVAGNWNPQGYGANPFHRIAILVG